jgi:hypothetical protein
VVVEDVVVECVVVECVVVDDVVWQTPPVPASRISMLLCGGFVDENFTNTGAVSQVFPACTIAFMLPTQGPESTHAGFGLSQKTVPLALRSADKVPYFSDIQFPCPSF